MSKDKEEKKAKKPKKEKASKEKPVKAKKQKASKEETELAVEAPEALEAPKTELENKSEDIPEDTEKEISAEEAVEGPAEEEAPPEEDELEIVEEKFYDLNLHRIWNAPREKRTPRAVRFLREFVSQRMKTSEVSISEEANSMLWQRGIAKPPRKIRIRVVKDKEGRVIVFPGEGKTRASNPV